MQLREGEPWLKENERLQDQVYLLQDEVKALKGTLDNNTVQWGVDVRLSPKESKVLSLIPFAPNWIAQDRLKEVLYGDDWDEPDSRTVAVFICWIRRKFYNHKAPFWVQTMWGGGYCLHKIDPDFWSIVDNPLDYKKYYHTPEWILSRNGKPIPSSRRE